MRTHLFAPKSWMKSLDSSMMIRTYTFTGGLNRPFISNSWTSSGHRTLDEETMIVGYPRSVAHTEWQRSIAFVIRIVSELNYVM